MTGSVSTSAGKLASVILNGQTLVAGGFIQTDLIDVDSLYCTSLAAVRGTIGGFTINTTSLTNNNGQARIRIEYSVNQFVDINGSGGTYMIASRNDYKTAASFSSQYNGGIALYLTGQMGAKALDSQGAVTFSLRDGETFWIDTQVTSVQHGIFRISGLPGRTSDGLRFSGQVRIHQSDGINFLVLV